MMTTASDKTQNQTLPQRAPDREPLPELLRELQPQITRLFARFRLPVDRAENILQDALLVMLYRQDQLTDPGRWLLRTLRLRCIMFWRERRQQAASALDEELRGWLGDSSASGEMRYLRRRQLEARIDRLPLPCRAVLRQRFHLPPRIGEGDAPRLRRHPMTRQPVDPGVRCLNALLNLLSEEG